MSGHSKWANIKRQKQANDLVRGNIFSKLSRIITLAVLEGGGITEPENNIKLRLAIDKARQANMPKDNIHRAIEKGAGPGKQDLKEIVYEGFASGGISLIILTATDNLNRSSSEIRQILERSGGKLGHQGSVAYLFLKCAVVTFKKSLADEEKVFRFSEKMQAIDIDQDNDYYYVFISFVSLGKIKENLDDLVYESVEVDYKPQTTVLLDNSEQIKHFTDLIDTLESLDDVQKVFSNAEIKSN